MTTRTKGTAGLLATAMLAAVANLGCDGEQATVPADDPERELAEQELEAERQAQEANRQVREGPQDAAQQLRDEQGGEGVADAFGGQEEYDRRQHGSTKPATRHGRPRRECART